MQRRTWLSWALAALASFIVVACGLDRAAAPTARGTGAAKKLPANAAGWTKVKGERAPLPPDVTKVDGGVKSLGGGGGGNCCGFCAHHIMCHPDGMGCDYIFVSCLMNAPDICSTYFCRCAMFASDNSYICDEACMGFGWVL